MTDADAIALSEAYFAAIDAHDAEALAAVLTHDATLSIETHGLRHEGRDAVVALFVERWKTGPRALHHDFTHTPSAAHGRIVSQFTATYSGPDAPEPKSNANVFSLAEGRIAGIQVYMSGANTIRS